MALGFANRVRFATATTGTGTLAVGAARPGFQTPAGAGLAAGTQVGYAIEDGANFEVGQGTYGAGTLTRDTVEASSSSGAAITLSGAATCFLTATAAQLTGGFGVSGFRNHLQNGQFNVQQRGAGPWSAAGHTADRWLLAMLGDTSQVSLQPLGDNLRTAIGDESANSMLLVNVSGSATAANYTQVIQRVENVRLLAGRTVTVSFWAAASGTPYVGVYLQQNFGTGGSPSAAVNLAPVSLQPTGNFGRYQATFAVPSLAGKTLGSNGDHYTSVCFALSSGATNAAALGVGAQSGSFYLWGAQLEYGSAASALEKRPVEVELALCQRFYQTGSFDLLGYQLAGGAFGATQQMPVTMRGTPTVVGAFTTSQNATAPVVAAFGNAAVIPNCTATATGPVYLTGTFTASADL